MRGEKFEFVLAQARNRNRSGSKALKRLQVQPRLTEHDYDRSRRNIQRSQSFD
jgi:hypothetical protein